MYTSNQYPIILQICPELLAVCRVSVESKLPQWVSFDSKRFTSVTKTHDELSIVCEQSLVPSDVKAQLNWRLLKIKGQLDFALVGILKQVITPLSDNGISIFTLSTFDTDYILIQQNDFERALEILKQYFEVELQ